LSKFPFDVIAVFFPAPYVNLTTNILWTINLCVVL
jgi:hypothetical protein